MDEFDQPTFWRICTHECRIVLEIGLINFIVSLMCHFMGIPHEYLIPIMAVLLLRTKRYDDNVFDDPFPLSMHLSRITLVLAFLMANTVLLAYHYADRQYSAPKKLSTAFDYGHFLFAQTFLSTIFSVIVLVMRSCCQFALLCNDLVENAQSDLADISISLTTPEVGPAGDAPPRHIRIPLSQSFPMIQPRRILEMTY